MAASTAFPGPDSRNEATPHQLAVVLRLDLLAFCSDAGRLKKFYEEVIATLPPVRPTVPYSDDGNDSD